MIRRNVTLPCNVRRGFTLVELLVVIAIIGVLIALLPACDSGGPRVRPPHSVRQQSSSNLPWQRRITSQTRKSCPSRPLLTWKSRIPAATAPSWRSILRAASSSVGPCCCCPYLEQQALYDAFDFSKTVFEQDRDPQAEFVDALLCPSDSARGRLHIDEVATAGKAMAKGNYAAYVSPVHIDLQLFWPGALIATGQPLSRIVDGTSHTIIYSEVRTLDHEKDERGAWAVPWAGSSILSFDMHHVCSDGSSFTIARPKVFYRPDPHSVGVTQLPNTRGRIKDTLFYCKDEQKVEADLQGMPCDGWMHRIGAAGFYSPLHPAACIPAA